MTAQLPGSTFPVGSRALLHFFSRGGHGLDNIPVARASAEVAGEHFSDFVLGRVRSLVEEGVH